MEKIVINIHSFIDVITNSSTELFMCNTKKSLEIIKTMLLELIEQYNKGVDEGKYDEKYGDKIYPATKSSINNFKEPYIYTEEMFLKDVEKYERNITFMIKYRLEEYLRLLHYNRKNKYAMERKRELEKYFDKIKNSEIIPNCGYELRKNIGKVIIQGSDDNSIPYQMFDLIKKTFGAKSYHLG